MSQGDAGRPNELPHPARILVGSVHVEILGAHAADVLADDRRLGRTRQAQRADATQARKVEMDERLGRVEEGVIDVRDDWKRPSRRALRRGVSFSRRRRLRLTAPRAA